MVDHAFTWMAKVGSPLSLASTMHKVWYRSGLVYLMVSRRLRSLDVRAVRHTKPTVSFE